MRFYSICCDLYSSGTIWIFIIHLLTAYIIFIHFICQRYSKTFISSKQEIQPQLLSSLTRYNRYRRFCHGLCFPDPDSHKRNICNYRGSIVDNYYFVPIFSQCEIILSICHFPNKR